MVYRHAFYDAMALDGAWEIAYQPYEWDSPVPPVFSGVRVENAVPGYWEDMIDAFRAAGMTCGFRVNPHFEPQTMPITGSARDMRLPNVYGCFFYRRTMDLAETGPAVLAFEGVRNQVHVWINGSFAGVRGNHRLRAQTSFRRDLLHGQ